MKSKIAILIIGTQNSGKTSTIKYFDKKFDENEREKKQCRSGWRNLQLFKEELGALFLLIFFVPSSPTESNKPLSKRFINFLPEVLLIAEQLNGSKYNNTIKFLEENGYEIVEFYISEDNKEEHWKRWNSIIEYDRKLNKRSEDIKNVLKKFILNRIA